MHYQADFLSCEEADRLFSVCRGLAWQTEVFQMFGKPTRAPRSLSWFGDPGLNYRYTGLDHPAIGWPRHLAELRDRVAAKTGARFNFLLLNKYEHGQQYMGWHRDDEAASAPSIASLSIGCARRFRVDANDGIRDLRLAHGSLLVFDGRLRHTLPKTQTDIATRINLTFRHIGA
jgi:alkylated DNA repair dioxygenase AlkB